MVKRLGIALSAVLFTLVAASQPVPILEYIRVTWEALTRSNRTLAAAAVDPKSHPEPDGRWPVYFPSGEDAGRIGQQLRREMGPADFAKIDLRPLLADLAHLPEQGLLYLRSRMWFPAGDSTKCTGGIATSSRSGCSATAWCHWRET